MLGSSKSLSKTIAVDAMEDMLSRKSVFPKMQGGSDSIFSMQPPFKARRIISTFLQCVQVLKGKNMVKFVSVVSQKTNQRHY